MYVNIDKSRAIMFNYLVNFRPQFTSYESPIKLNGLDADKKYHIKETNLYPNTSSTINPETIYSGDFLMKIGINPEVSLQRTSVILEITEVQ